MEIVILTKGRTDNQRTIRNMPKSLRPRIRLICPRKELGTHQIMRPYVQAIAQPDDNWTVSQKRYWIVTDALARGVEKLVMLDDDVRFCLRRADDPAKFSVPNEDDVVHAFEQMEAHLSEAVPHAGFAARGGSISPTAQKGGWQRAKRMMYVLGYHLPTLIRETKPFQMRSREDMETTLQLLVKGYPNLVNYTLTVDQQFENTGGCLAERDFAKANADAELLAQLYPGLVKVVAKDIKAQPGLSDAARTRLEVIVQWVKAYEQGKQRREAGPSGS